MEKNFVFKSTVLALVLLLGMSLLCFVANIGHDDQQLAPAQTTQTVAAETVDAE